LNAGQLNIVRTGTIHSSSSLLNGNSLKVCWPWMQLPKCSHSYRKTQGWWLLLLCRSKKIINHCKTC